MTRSVLSLLAKIFPPVDWALSFERRQRDLNELAGGVGRTLKSYNLNPPSPQEMEEFSSHPPYDTREDLVAACCTRFSRTNGIHSDNLELLYRDFHCEPTASVWGRISSDEEKKWELARILVKSTRLPRIENVAPEDMETLVGRILDGLDGSFGLESVQDELRSWSRIWDHLAGYAGSLNAEGIPAAPCMRALIETVERVIETRPLGDIYERAAVEALLEASRAWIGDWAKASAVKPEDGNNLALVHLGLFNSEHEAAGRPLLAALGCLVAASRDALDMLLAYLWAKSQPDTASVRGLKELALHWEEWRKAAKTDMGLGIAGQVLEVLTSDLRKGDWPSQLPIQRAVAEISRQVRESHIELAALRKGHKKTQGLMEKIEKLYEWAGGDKSRLSVSEDSLAEIKKTVDAAVKAKLLQLAPPAASSRPQSLKRELETFVRRFPPETLPANHEDHGGQPPIVALASLRERAADLGHELEEVSDMLLAQAGGAQAYLITFDQSRGSLAELIDNLAKDYGYEHYTRYSRIGLLRKGETFESFYRQFLRDLEKELVKKFKDAASGDWLQIEVTFQPINLLHRHELATAAEKDLKGSLPAGAVIRKLFRIAPSGRVLQPAA